jgi:hypothetical protein
MALEGNGLLRGWKGMNKKSQVGILGLLLWVFVIILSIIMIPPIKELITIARSADYLDCAATNLSTGIAATCLVIDLYLPYFIAVVFISGSSLVAYQSFRYTGGV